MANTTSPNPAPRCGDCRHFRSGPIVPFCQKHPSLSTIAADAPCRDFHPANPQRPERKPAP